MTTEEVSISLKPGTLFEKKSSRPFGNTPILSQGEDDYIGFHDEAPGVLASEESPVATFANHTCVMRLMRRPFSCIQNIFPKTGRPGIVNTRFFYYASLGRVSLTDYKGHHPIFRSALIPVPPLEDQLRIVAVLQPYDDLIELNRRRVTLLEKAARGLFEEWFVRFRFPGHETVQLVDTPDGPLPGGWAWARLGELGTLRSGNNKLTKAVYRSEGYTAYSASGPDGLVDHAEFKGQAVVVSAVGAYCGKTWLSSGEWTLIANTFCVLPQEDVPAEFLFLGTWGIDKWPRRGAAQPFVAKMDAAQILLPRPPVEVWNRFQEVAGPIMSSIRTLAAANQRLSAARDLLLPRLISGQLSVVTAKRDLAAA